MLQPPTDANRAEEGEPIREVLEFVHGLPSEQMRLVIAFLEARGRIPNGHLSAWKREAGRIAGTSESAVDRCLDSLDADRCQQLDRLAPRLQSLSTAERRQLRFEREHIERKIVRETGRRARLSRREEIERAVARARELQIAGRLDDAARHLDERGLNRSSVLRAVRRQSVRELADRLEIVRAEIEMGRGNPLAAVQLTRRLVGRALSPEDAVRTACTQGAALRMLGRSHWREAAHAFELAASHAREASHPDEMRYWLRWALASSTTPLLLISNDHAAVESRLETAMDLLDGSADNEAETRLLRARVALLRGGRAVDLALGDIAAVAARKTELPVWLLGWLPRYEIDARVTVFPESWNPQDGALAVSEADRELLLELFAASWRSTATGGFQRDILLSRAAMLGFESAELHAVGLQREVALEVASRHFRNTGCKGSSCPRCARAPLERKIVCALQLEDYEVRKNLR